ncbi:MAG: bifunctional adenosylcobinamide kinase/adenosylcobinamide-phosphate guanylyltransferase [bacterium]
MDIGEEANSVLFLGGTRSGKSSKAAQLAQIRGGDVTVLTTARPIDEEMEERIQRHRDERPDDWTTIEPGYDLNEITQRLSEENDVVLFDEVSLLVSSWIEGGADEQAVLEKIRKFNADRKRGKADWIIVSALVGRSLVPPAENARRYRDVLGKVNQVLAYDVDEVYEVTAGLLNCLKPGNPTTRNLRSESAERSS